MVASSTTHGVQHKSTSRSRAAARRLRRAIRQGRLRVAARRGPHRDGEIVQRSAARHVCPDGAAIARAALPAALLLVAEHWARLWRDVALGTAARAARHRPRHDRATAGPRRRRPAALPTMMLLPPPCSVASSSTRRPPRPRCRRRRSAPPASSAMWAAVRPAPPPRARRRSNRHRSAWRASNTRRRCASCRRARTGCPSARRARRGLRSRGASARPRARATTTFEAGARARHSAVRPRAR